MAFTEKMNPEWITINFNEEAVDWTNKFAEYLAKDTKLEKGFAKALTTSQLRKFFGQLRRIQADYEKLQKEIPLLKPKLAYAVGRAEKDNKINDFYLQIEGGLSLIKGNKESFDRFISLTESIVAYHKFHGGK